MKLDLDLLRDTLIAISDNLYPDENGYVQPIMPKEFVSSAIPQYKSNEVLYWIRKMMDEGILIAGKRYIDEPIPRIKDISITGYKFLESFKEPSIWEKVKPKLSDLAVSSFIIDYYGYFSYITLTSIKSVSSAVASSLFCLTEYDLTPFIFFPSSFIPLSRTNLLNSFFEI